MVSCFYFIFSIFTSVSIAYSVLDYNWMMWGLVFCTIVVCAVVFGVLEKMLKNIIKENYLMLMSREVSAFVGTLFFIGLSCYVIYHGNMPDYLRPALIDTIKAASDSAYSNCDYTSYVLEFKKNVRGVCLVGHAQSGEHGLK